MGIPKANHVDEGRAAVLLGLTTEQIRHLSEEAGLGRKESRDQHERMFFTYEELHRLCQLATRLAA